MRNACPPKHCLSAKVGGMNGITNSMNALLERDGLKLANPEGIQA